MITTCATCRYSRPGFTGDGLEPEPEGERNWIFCQHSPPAPIPGHVDVWPAVSPGEVCGEWAPARGTSDTVDAAAVEDDPLDALIEFLLHRFNDIDTRLTAIQRHLTPYTITLKPNDS